MYFLLNIGLDEDVKEYIMNILNSFKLKNLRYGKVFYLDVIVLLKYEECFEKDIFFDVYI